MTVCLRCLTFRICFRSHLLCRNWSWKKNAIYSLNCPHCECPHSNHSSILSSKGGHLWPHKLVICDLQVGHLWPPGWSFVTFKLVIFDLQVGNLWPSSWSFVTFKLVICDLLIPIKIVSCRHNDGATGRVNLSGRAYGPCLARGVESSWHSLSYVFVRFGKNVKHL